MKVLSAPFLPVVKPLPPVAFQKLLKARTKTTVRMMRRAVSETKSHQIEATFPNQLSINSYSCVSSWVVKKSQRKLKAAKPASIKKSRPT